MNDKYNDEKFMKIAIENALIAKSRDEVPVGAIVVLDNKIIGHGYNLIESQKNPVAHAEIRAILDACRTLDSWRLLKSTLYTTVEPCIMCMGAALHARVSTIVYGCPDWKWGGVKTKIKINEIEGLNHKLEVRGDVLSQDCSDLMSKFFLGKRKKNKKNN